MNFKLLGGILLVAGTSIGGGMLALPIVTAKAGFYDTFILIGLCWALMTFTAFITLEINLWFPEHSNIITMASSTLGRPGKIISWTLYFLFLYTLVSAYIAGGSDVMHGLFFTFQHPIPLWFSACLFTIIFGFFVFHGAHSVDVMNRFLMLLKAFALMTLIFYLLKNIKLSFIHNGNSTAWLPATTVMISSFGFSAIIPTLRTYLKSNIQQLKMAILIGSLLPFLCYTIWELSIFGIIPVYGKFGLVALTTLKTPVSGLVISIIHFLPLQTIKTFARFFTSICVLTSFMCVSLSLSDFVADGFKIKKTGAGNYAVFALTFLPPLVIVISYPKAFILGLTYSGLCCIILQALMPILMVWRGRYTQDHKNTYQVFGGKIALFTGSIASSIVIAIGLYQLF